MTQRSIKQVQPCWTLVKFDNILLNLPKLKRMSNICSSPSYTRVDFSKKKISQNLTHILGIQGNSEIKNFFIVFLYFEVFKLYISEWISGSYIIEVELMFLWNGLKFGCKCRKNYNIRACPFIFLSSLRGARYYWRLPYL